ncbi:hypothetical protein K491DRAFT_680611 [Lophiostoma macrostomum CBS 122681]|uniref:DUF3669 domain-containing protein n=1 Tax=Lophiostoma macrostomum CBS 122681 TaxID=1314788 RepID=A0A6A6T3C7_9PLEO|nr:hypothetical protein K491DRAFT_680611 [Lophiostoma macrostomum CBS 122681]
MSQDNSRSTFRCIGKGSCGSVWAQNEFQAIKREDCHPERSVQNDFNMHRRLLEALEASRHLTKMCVPRCHELIQNDNTRWWDEHGPNFPASYSHCKTLISERIPALNATARQHLIQAFCPTERQEFVKSNPSDQDCLVRLYLGRRRHTARSERPSKLNIFSLRNFPLHLDQVELLGLDALPYAKIMAETLAVMHWAAGIDGNDVEFVLASPRCGDDSTTTFDSPSIGRHALWVLDFDCCRSMTPDEHGVEQACGAFFRNDPYYPRPNPANEGDDRLWLEFRRHFIETSRNLLGSDSELPEMLMTRIEAVAMEKRREQVAAASNHA